MNKPQFTSKGQCHGVNLVHRSNSDDEAMVQIFTEDDGTWNQSMSFDNFWLDDLILVLQSAQKRLKQRGVKGKHQSIRLRSRDVVDDVHQIFEDKKVKV
jgi:hypothetical protein